MYREGLFWCTGKCFSRGSAGRAAEGCRCRSRACPSPAGPGLSAPSPRVLPGHSQRSEDAGGSRGARRLVRSSGRWLAAAEEVESVPLTGAPSGVRGRVSVAPQSHLSRTAPAGRAAGPSKATGQHSSHGWSHICHRTDLFLRQLVCDLLSYTFDFGDGDQKKEDAREEGSKPRRGEELRAQWGRRRDLKQAL